MTAACSHKAEWPEGSEWPADVSLDHFLHCFDADRQLEVWKGIRTAADQGTRCTLQDHSGRLQSMLVGQAEQFDQLSLLRQVQRTDQAYIASLVGQMRDLIREGSRDGAHIREQLAVMVSSNRAQSLERLKP